MKPDALQQARHGIAPEMRRAIAAIVTGATLLLLLAVAAHQAVSRSEELENGYHRPAAALADRLHLTLRGVRVPPGFDGTDLPLRAPVAFEAQAERSFGAARTIVEDIEALQKRYDHDRSFVRAMARLARGVKGLEALRERHAGDRTAFALALATTDTYLEVVALQLRRQHEAAVVELLSQRRKLIMTLEIAGALVLLIVVLGTRRSVRRSFAAIDAILAVDARQSVALEESLAARGAALREKDVLLKEVYHRVKNNLQVVSSLLNMQGREVSDPEALRLLNDSANRVRSMALVHEQLYRSKDLGKISCGEFLEELAARLSESYAPSARTVRLVTHADGLELGLGSAVPCALILNELVANAFTHAFPAGSTGTIAATLESLPDGRARLAVEDDGKGLPEGFSADTSSTLGMRIVVTLARQLGGELICAGAGERGTRCEVVFRPED